MKRWRRVGLCILIAMIAVSGCGEKFDAKEYTQALLDQYFQGEVSEMAKIQPDVTQVELKQEYEENISWFVKNSIQGDVEMSDDMVEKFHGLCKHMFSAMRYEVQGVKRKDSKTYEVTVTIQPTDVMLQFLQTVQESQNQLLLRIRDGEFSGTEEEVRQQVSDVFISDAYTNLEQACTDMKYGKKKNIVLVIKRDNKKKYSIAPKSFTKLYNKMLRLDEIGGVGESKE